MVKSMPMPSCVSGLIAVAALVFSVAGCAGAEGHAHHFRAGQPAPSGHGGTSTWLFAGRALDQVLVDADVRGQLGRSRIFEIVPIERRPRAERDVVPTVKFSSYASLKQTLAAGGLPSWVGAVLYDNEAWAFTPEVEQRAPGLYTAMAAQLTHRHHLLFLASPALDLTTVLSTTPARPAAAYLDLGLAAQGAKGANVVNIQAQRLERSTRAYVAFVKAAAAQARRANPGVTVLAGLSSNPTGAPVTTAQLTQAIAGTRAYVDGYWMNIPSPGPACPRCNPPRPDLAIAAIRTLSR